MMTPKITTVLNELTGSGAPAKWFEPHGCLQTVLDMPAPGFIRHIKLGSEGLQISHGHHLVVIPKDLLLALAESVDPTLRPPGAKELETLAAQNESLVPKPAA